VGTEATADGGESGGPWRGGAPAAFDLPAGDWSEWHASSSTEWVMVSPTEVLPEQGWKIHCSAVLHNAQDVLGIVADYCRREKIAFKFVPTLERLSFRVSKAAPASAGGKFITVYPGDAEVLARVLTDVGEALSGFAAPSIQGDLRWQDGPLHVRYGAFSHRDALDLRGRVVPAIVAPDGRSVPDVRGTQFVVPEWVELPDILAAQLAEVRSRSAGGLAAYEVRSAEVITNAGGVYRAVRRSDGLPVVLKEARPHVAAHGVQAVDALRAEAQALRRAAGVPGVVELVAEHDLEGHFFLVLKEAPGAPLNRSLFSLNPLVAQDASPAAKDAYRDRALDIIDKLSVTVAELHRRGIVHGDLHPGNVIVSDAGEPVIIDLESASALSASSSGPRIGVPGYAAPEHVTGAYRDLYAVAAITLNAFLPLSFLHPLEPCLVQEHVADATALFDLPDARRSELLEVLRAWPNHAPRLGHGADREPAVRYRHEIAADLERSATASDPSAPEIVPGALLAVAAAGLPARELRARELMRRSSADRSTLLLARPGGRAHVALSLSLPGARDLALRAEQEALSQTEWLDLGLAHGAAGLGLFLMALQDRWPTAARATHVRRIHDLLADAVSRGQPCLPGLMVGGAGKALFFLRHRSTHHGADDLALARSAIAADVRQGAASEDGSWGLRDGTRSVPYLGAGGAGVGLAILRYLEQASDGEFEGLLPRIERASSADLCINAGLLEGRAGLMLFLAHLHVSGRGSESLVPVMARHVDRLRWHAIGTEAGLTFPGVGLSGPSRALDHGSAGVLCGLEAARIVVAEGREPGSSVIPDPLHLAWRRT